MILHKRQYSRFTYQVQVQVWLTQWLSDVIMIHWVSLFSFLSSSACLLLGPLPSEGSPTLLLQFQTSPPGDNLTGKMILFWPLFFKMRETISESLWQTTSHIIGQSFIMWPCLNQSVATGNRSTGLAFLAESPRCVTECSVLYNFNWFPYLHYTGVYVSTSCRYTFTFLLEALFSLFLLSHLPDPKCLFFRILQNPSLFLPLCLDV